MALNAASSKVVYALLQKAGITGQQVCLVEVPSGTKLAAAAQQSLLGGKRPGVISLDFEECGGAPSPNVGFGGTKIISTPPDTSQHFRKRKMLQEPRLLDTEEAAIALPAQRIIIGAATASVLPVIAPDPATDSKIRTESESMVLQKAPLESSSYSTVSFDELDDDDDLMGSSYYGRKRARLNHLTADEKMTRRKVMNRIAAQQARDRKKQKMEKMETALQRLEVENRYLRCENTELKEKLEKLGSRLNHLLVQLEGGCGQSVSALSGARQTSADRTAGPVATPRQQGRGLARLLMMLALALQLVPPAAHSGSLSSSSKLFNSRIERSRRSRIAAFRAAAGLAAGKWHRLQTVLATRRKCQAWVSGSWPPPPATPMLATGPPPMMMRATS